MYSHTGTGESLLYTNNSFMLGPDLQPNSIKFSFMGKYICNPDFIITAQYDNIRHGDNITDQNGKIIRNVGGNIADFYRLGDSRKTHILDGIIAKTDKISVNCEYEFSLGFYLGVQFDYMITSQQERGSQKMQNYWGIFRYNIL
jgi:hypothetical protein